MRTNCNLNCIRFQTVINILTKRFIYVTNIIRITKKTTWSGNFWTTIFIEQFCNLSTKLTLSPPNTEFSVFPWFHCYTLGGAIMHLLIKNICEEDTETNNLICKQMQMKNNEIINNKQHINENCLTLQSEMSVQEGVLLSTVQALGVLMEVTYCIFALIIVMNMIHM